jgi:hypothetical protein
MSAAGGASGLCKRPNPRHLFGSFENLILNLTWHKNGPIQVDTATLKYNDRQLDGHGRYVVKGKAHASRLTATKD